MSEIGISVQNKIASVTSGTPRIVCGNSDYTLTFAFDEEFSAYTEKTLCIVYRRRGKMVKDEVQFTGDTVDLPVLYETDMCAIGVYAGNLISSTVVMIPCDYCAETEHHDPPPDIYEQLLEYLAGLQGGGASAGAATLMISGGVSDIGGDTRATTKLLSGEIPLINAVRYPVNNAVGNAMICDAREMRCTTKDIYEVPAGKAATVSCAVLGMQITGWQMNDRFICTGNSFSTWQDFPLVIDNTTGSESMFAALNFRRSDNSDVSPSDFGTIVATLE